MNLCDQVLEIRKKNIINYYGLRDDNTINSDALVIPSDKPIKKLIVNKKADEYEDVRACPNQSIYVDEHLHESAVNKYENVEIDQNNALKIFLQRRSIIDLMDDIKKNKEKYIFFKILAVKDSLRRIAKYEMGKTRRKYYIFIRNLLINSGMMRYMFDKPSLGIISLKNLFKFYNEFVIADDILEYHSKTGCNDDNYFNKRIVSHVNGVNFMNELKNIILLKNKYDFDRIAHYSAHHRCQNYYVEKSNILKPGIFDYKLSKVSVPSKIELEMIDVLNMLSKKYPCFLFFYNHRFKWCKYEIVLEYDFFCLMVDNGKLIPFVIETDGDQHYDCNHFFFGDGASHIRDVVKQYYLRCMNVHLLRVRNINSLFADVMEFIKKIINSKVYVVTNPIKPIKKYFESDETIFGLQYFYDFCVRNEK